MKLSGERQRQGASWMTTNIADRSAEYFRGAVHSYNPASGFGFIQADPDQGLDKVLLLHSKSLRRPGDSLESGDRVLFSTCRIAAGVLATEVHPETVDEGIVETPAEIVDGYVKDFIPTRGFGFITLNDGREAFFHVTCLTLDRKSTRLNSSHLGISY